MSYFCGLWYCLAEHKTAIAALNHGGYAHPLTLQSQQILGDALSSPVAQYRGRFTRSEGEGCAHDARLHRQERITSNDRWFADATTATTALHLLLASGENQRNQLNGSHLGCADDFAASTDLAASDPQD